MQTGEARLLPRASANIFGSQNRDSMSFTRTWLCQEALATLRKTMGEGTANIVFTDAVVTAINVSHRSVSQAGELPTNDKNTSFEIATSNILVYPEVELQHLKSILYVRLCGQSSFFRYVRSWNPTCHYQPPSTNGGSVRIEIPMNLRV